VELPRSFVLIAVAERSSFPVARKWSTDQQLSFDTSATDCRGGHQQHAVESSVLVHATLLSWFRWPPMGQAADNNAVAGALNIVSKER
jgi:hypothetical protein